MDDTIRYAWGQGSLGDFIAAVSDRGLVMIEFGDRTGTLAQTLHDRFPDAEVVEDPAFMAEILRRLIDLIEHPEVKADMAVDLRGTDFELRVWKALQQVPPGETVSYGDIAARVGSPKDACDVAEACAANVVAVVIPCHRVVKKNGSISGYRWGFKRKRSLIERERRADFRLT